MVLFLFHQADPIKQFIVAAEKNDIPTIYSLIESTKHKGLKSEAKLKELLSAKDQDGYTALHRAAYAGSVDVLRVSCCCYYYYYSVALRSWGNIRLQA
ncbi:unnamed protein product [Trichobilharzia regenti]|nr:unnamed protein product [Trichobilharzia regenti]